MSHPFELPDEGVPPEALCLLEESDRLYEEEVALVTEQMRPQYDAIMNLSEEEYLQRVYEMYCLREDLLADPQSRRQVRNARIAERFR